jgi:hypothetical protein
MAAANQGLPQDDALNMGEIERQQYCQEIVHGQH